MLKIGCVVFYFPFLEHLGIGGNSQYIFFLVDSLDLL